MSLYYVLKLLYPLNREPAVWRRFKRDRDELLAYTDADTFRDTGQGRFEIQNLIAGAMEGTTGEWLCYAPIPIFAVGCTVATMAVR